MSKRVQKIFLKIFRNCHLEVEDAFRTSWQENPVEGYRELIRLEQKAVRENWNLTRFKTEACHTSPDIRALLDGKTLASFWTRRGRT